MQAFTADDVMSETPHRQPSPKSRKPRRLWSWLWRVALLIVALDAAYLVAVWPDWSVMRGARHAKSNFIESYERQRAQDPRLPPLRWYPVALNDVPAHLRQAVIVAEDARFYQHDGFDFVAFTEAMTTNFELGDFRYGASTISQQTVKNMFFSGSRSLLRKWHELIVTLGMELNVSKHRILQTYLNVAEFGPGVYGVEAAAQHYWGIPVSALNEQQAVELAATLPSPLKDNPATRTTRFRNRVARIQSWLDVRNRP